MNWTHVPYVRHSISGMNQSILVFFNLFFFFFFCADQKEERREERDRKFYGWKVYKIVSE